MCDVIRLFVFCGSQTPLLIQITSFYRLVATVDDDWLTSGNTGGTLNLRPSFRATKQRHAKGSRCSWNSVGKIDSTHAGMKQLFLWPSIIPLPSSSVRFSISTRGRDTVGWEHSCMRYSPVEPILPEFPLSTCLPWIPFLRAPRTWTTLFQTGGIIVGCVVVVINERWVVHSSQRVRADWPTV